MNDINIIILIIIINILLYVWLYCFKRVTPENQSNILKIFFFFAKISYTFRCQFQNNQVKAGGI